jgi:hypothetical protein
MACCDFYEEAHRGEPKGDGERDYHEHIEARRLSVGEIFVVVVAAVMLAGMGLAHQGAATSPQTTGSIATSYSQPVGGSARCSDDDHYLSERCEP